MDVNTAAMPVTVDALMQELMTIQSSGSKKVAILGARHISLTHQQLIEMLAYALALTGNTVLTSGAAGTSRGAGCCGSRLPPGSALLPRRCEPRPRR